MFYYYGAKNILCRYYDPPLHSLIIEPFAGSASYSCYHLKRNPNLQALLYEKDDRVVSLWRYLLSASEQDILHHPKPNIGEHTTDFFIITCAASNASAKSSKMVFSDRIDRVFEIQKRKVLNLFPIRDRIQIIHGDYKDVSDQTATWFIDPPYQIHTKSHNNQNGDGYSTKCGASHIDYTSLSEWCKERQGQVIVCEKEGADWLPFIPFKMAKTSQNKRYAEVVWGNNEGGLFK